MKGLKYIAVLFIYPVALMVLGFVCGLTCAKVFYPGSFQMVEEKSERSDDWQVITGTPDRVEELASKEEQTSEPEVNLGPQDTEAQEVATLLPRLTANTSYVLEETDMRNETVVETTWKLPAKYIGMNREQFLEEMEMYEASPPLQELARGFVSLEVLSFSPQKVVVQMNYDLGQPEECFYLMVEDNYVMVYLEDKITLYMDTDISLKDLPEDIQQEIIHVKYVPDEESLYDFLENYTS